MWWWTWFWQLFCDHKEIEIHYRGEEQASDFFKLCGHCGRVEVYFWLGGMEWQPAELALTYLNELFRARVMTVAGHNLKVALPEPVPGGKPEKTKKGGT